MSCNYTCGHFNTKWKVGSSRGGSSPVKWKKTVLSADKDALFFVNDSSTMGIRMQREIGKGSFGTVRMGKETTHHSGDRSVAVKGAFDEAKEEELLNEITTLHALGPHQNVVQMLYSARTIDKDQKIFLVEKYCHYGSCNIYLQKNKMSFFDNGLDALIDHHRLLLKICYNVASAMAYLETKFITHGDVCLQNILLAGYKINDGIELVAKISDFGSSTMSGTSDSYKKFHNKSYPTLLMENEASDVYCFGTLVWEVISFGQAPLPVTNENDLFIDTHQDIPPCPTEIKSLLEFGYEHFYRDISRMCMNDDKTMRAEFKDVLKFIYHQLTQDEKDEYDAMAEEDSQQIEM